MRLFIQYDTDSDQEAENKIQEMLQNFLLVLCLLSLAFINFLIFKDHRLEFQEINFTVAAILNPLIACCFFILFYLVKTTKFIKEN